jgi:hypothetical protein
MPAEGQVKRLLQTPSAVRVASCEWQLTLPLKYRQAGRSSLQGASFRRRGRVPPKEKAPPGGGAQSRDQEPDA